MALPRLTPPKAKPAIPRDEYEGLEELDRPELDEAEGEQTPSFPPLSWDDDGKSGIKERANVPPPQR